MRRKGGAVADKGWARWISSRLFPTFPADASSSLNARLCRVSIRRIDMGKGVPGSHSWSRHSTAWTSLNLSPSLSRPVQDCSQLECFVGSRHLASQRLQFSATRSRSTTRYKPKQEPQAFGTTLTIFTLLSTTTSSVHATHLDSSVIPSSQTLPKDQGWHRRPPSLLPVFYSGAKMAMHLPVALYPPN